MSGRYIYSDGAVQPIVFKEPPMYRHSDTAKYAAEFVGTFFLVFTIGCNVHTGSIGAALSIGAILMVMVYALGPVSGGHLNPAVTLAIGLSGRGKISFDHMVYYMISQVLGGLVGAFCYWTIFNDGFILQPIAGYTTRHAAWSEILFTMALCYVVLNVATTENRTQGNCKFSKVPNSFYGLAIGLTVTSAAIAVGPISGCSLNPAVSLGAMFASKLAHGYFAMNMAGLYTLAPFFGACLATLFFYFVQGGLTGQFEYEMIGTRPASPMISVPTSPMISVPYVGPEKPRIKCELLGKGEICILTKEEEQHNIFFGLSWQIDDTTCASSDIDASCVKFTSDGTMIEGIYFNNHSGKEKRKTGESIIRHQGDNLTGKGVGFGFIEDPHRHKRDGQPREIQDCERIEIRGLNELRKYQARCTYMFFVINVFSAAHKFKHMTDMTIRIVDQDNDSNEICRFSKTDLSKGPVTGNGFVMGVLRWHRDWEKWVFQIIDEAFDLKEHGTYRDFEPKLREYVLKMEGRMGQ